MWPRNATIKTRLAQIGITVGLIVACEGLLRVFSSPPTVDYYELYRLHGADGYEMLDKMGVSIRLLHNANNFIQADEERLWRLTPNVDLDAQRYSFTEGPAWTIHTNSAGFRDREDEHSSMVALGDSCTFGFGVENNWTDLVEPMLNTSILNMAVPGYSSAQGNLLLSNDQQVDTLFLNFGANDGHMVFTGDLEHIRKRRTKIGKIRYLLASLHFVQHGRAWLYSFWAKGTVVAWKSGMYRPRVTPQGFRQAHVDMIAKAKRTVILDICARGEYSKVMHELSVAYPQVDLLRYKDLDEKTLDGCHPTPAGHQKIAAAVNVLLTKNKVYDQSQKPK